MVLYFGCGTSEHRELIVALFDRVPENFRAKLNNYGLFLETWEDIPVNARKILINFWPDQNFRSWLILPWPKAEVWGRAWVITDEEMAIVGEWELRGLWFSEGDVIIENEQGLNFPAKTEKTYYAFQPTNGPANSLNFQIYPNPKHLMIVAARTVRQEFLSGKHGDKAVKRDKSELKKIVNNIEKTEKEIWQVDQKIIKGSRDLVELLKVQNVSMKIKIKLIKDLLPKIDKFYLESIDDLIRLKTRLIELSANNLETKKLKTVIMRIEEIILTLSSYVPHKLDEILAQMKNEETQSTVTPEFLQILETIFKKTAKIRDLVTKEQKEFSEISQIISIIKEST